MKSPDIDEKISFLQEAHEHLLNIITENQVSDKEGRWFQMSKNLLSDIVDYLNSLHIQTSEIIIIAFSYSSKNIKN